MTAPFFYPRLIEPPQTTDYNTEKQFRRAYDLWERTGGFDNYIPNLIGLKSSVSELNTLQGINTATFVQDQLDLKQNAADLKDMAFQESSAISITGGVVSNVSFSNATLTSGSISGMNITNAVSVTVASSGSVAEVGGVLTIDTTPVSSGNSVPTDLITYTLTSDSLDEIGSHIHVKAWGTSAPNADDKILTFNFGSEEIYTSGSVAIDNVSWIIECDIIEKAANSQEAVFTITSSDVSVLPSSSRVISLTQDITTNLIIKCTGEGPSNGDLTQRGLMIHWFPEV